MNNLQFNSVENIPILNAQAAFQVDSSAVFREQGDIVPTIVDDRTSYMPWGGDNQMPFDILNLIESDETLSTCQIFNAEVCYGSGLVYQSENCSPQHKEQIEDFFLDNDIASYYLGVSQDFKHFGFAVSVIMLNEPVEKVDDINIAAWSEY